MKTIYLHIGAPKTGTSALQHFFYMNAERMYEDGIWYPEFEASLKIEEKLGLFSGNATFLRQCGRKLEDICEEEKKQVKKILDKIIMEEKDTLLSSELLFWSGAELYQNLKSWGVNVKVIVYLRRQDYWGESMWNQNIKKSAYMMVKPCFEYILESNALLDYYKKLQEIATVIGKENIIVRTYESAGAQDTFSDFFKILGINDISKYTKDKYQANPSLSANYVEIKRILNGIPDNDILIDNIRDIMEEGRTYTASEDKVRSAPLFLSKEERQIILDKYAEGNEKIAKEYLGREKLFSEEMPEGKVGIDTETIYADIIKFFGSLFVRQSKQIDELRKKARRIELPDDCEGKKVIVYGIDRGGKELYEYLKSASRVSEIIAVDKRWEIVSAKYGFTVMNPEIIDYGTTDYIMIGVGDEKTYLSIKEYLILNKHVEEKKIIRMKLLE